MKILLLGKYGQLGWELDRCLRPLGEVHTLDYPEIDLADEDQIRKVVREAAPQIIVNATAYTAVDRAESEAEAAMAINARAPGVLAEEAKALSAALIHYSTDYVFDGTKGSPYQESDAPNPLNVYGRSKLSGEGALGQVGGVHLTFRTSWVYSLRRGSFVTKALGWARKQPELRVVTDQVGSPTWARMLAETSAQVLAMGIRAGSPAHLLGWLGERAGVYHLGGEGAASRLEWVQAILENDPRKDEQVARRILPALTSEFPTPARRPLYSALDCGLFAETFGLRLPHWRDSLRLAMESD